MTTQKVIEAAERYVSRQPVHEHDTNGEPLYMAGQMLRAFSAGEIAVIDQSEDKCPVCAKPLQPSDVCATDIEMGTCHAACLEGSPVVDLETGEEIHGAVDTYPYSVVMDPPAGSLRKFKTGAFVRKTKGSWWEGYVVGFYSTAENPDGVVVQLDKPNGPVQIYPSAALELAPAPVSHVVGSEERGIGIGMAIAAGIIMRVWGQEVYAHEILTTAGFTTLDELKASGVDQFDIDALMPIFAATATEGSGE